MAKFDREKALRKIEFNRKWRSYSRYVYIAVPCVLCGLLCLYFAYSKFFVSKDQDVMKTTVGDFMYGDVLIGAYVDGQYSRTIPSRTDGYTVEKVVCDGDTEGKWDVYNWGLLTTNINERSRCSVYFIKAESKVPDIIATADRTGKCPTLNHDGTVSVTAKEATDGYLCRATDTYGDSYYYRGNVTNNYVYFADKYWRIIRINGDGTVRVIYDGTSAHENGEASSDRQVGTSAFNSDYRDNSKVGYMYGDNDTIVEATAQVGTVDWNIDDTYYVSKEYNFDDSTKQFSLKDPIAVKASDLGNYIGYYTSNDKNSGTSYVELRKVFSVNVKTDESKVTWGYGMLRYGTSSKEQAQTNKNSSTIKNYLDNWYKKNISDTPFENYVVDDIFCNDRSISEYMSGVYNNKGSGVNPTLYRWAYGPWNGSSYGNMNMMLTCPQQNDAFTVSDTTNGNGALTYPIGLITTDEIVLAGGWNADNNGYYLYTGSWYWASSPYYFNGYRAYVRYVRSNGSASNDYWVDDAGGVRPVLNLKADVLAVGTGTASDPYRISS